MKKNAVEDENSYTVLLPKKIEDAKYAKQGADIIKNIIFERNLPMVNLLKVNTLVFNLLDLINTYATDHLASCRSQLFSDEYYCHKAINYISRHRGEAIKVAAVAQELELSVGYLSRIFKSCTGYTLIEYINDIKINTVKEILANRSASLEELGAIVGVNDEKYLCRLFKQHTGMTITEFKNSLKEM